MLWPFQDIRKVHQGLEEPGLCVLLFTKGPKNQISMFLRGKNIAHLALGQLRLLLILKRQLLLLLLKLIFTSENKIRKHLTNNLSWSIVSTNLHLVSKYGYCR